MPDPLAIAEVSRQSLIDSADQEHRSSLGQFFTPPATARLMASLSNLERGHLRLLDAGAGGGALTAAWVAQICSRPNRPKEISITAVEIDERFHLELTQTLKACERACAQAGIRCQWDICLDDFITAAVHSLDNGLFHERSERYDVAILNPPYKKLRSDSVSRRLLHRLGIETSNLYTAFLSLALLLLDNGGELIAITPRSFCNGPYFLPFRRHLLRSASLTHVHLFESRNQTFREDEVLQENVILRAVKGVPQHSHVLISQSRSPDDPNVTSNPVTIDQVLKKGDPQLFLHLVIDEKGHEVAQRIEALPCTLADLGLTVSTGRVVDFRARQWVRKLPSAQTVPLIYPAHFENGAVLWPKTDIRKPNAIFLDPQSSTLMVPTGPYALVRRFSSKEERRRVVAAFFEMPHSRFTVVGFENHLNYYHHGGQPLDQFLAKGLVAFLNSTIVDTYFRQFNGHTQVNAQDLRALRYPNENALIALGHRLGDTLPEQDALDLLVEEIIKSDERKPSPASHHRNPDGAYSLRVAQRTTE